MLGNAPGGLVSRSSRIARGFGQASVYFIIAQR
jgi:hypothetical protein